MKMSTKGRYGLRLMLDIALNGTGAPVSLKDVAARQEISEKYLEQIINKLSKVGLVRGMRGARGGYVLAREAQDITAGEILRAVEGGLAPVDCIAHDKASCPRAEACATIDLWRDVLAAVESVVDQRSLAQLVESYTKKTSPQHE